MTQRATSPCPAGASHAAPARDGGTRNDARDARDVPLPQRFRERLLPSSIEHARTRIPAYAELLAAAPRVRCVADLAALPITDKDALFGRPDAYRAADLETVLVQRTSGPWRLCGATRRGAVLAGLESQLRIMTLLLEEQRFDWGRSAVRRIVSCGDLLTARLRRTYETRWGVPVQDRYGMTEVFGGASPCPECAKWHFDCFTVPEAVDLHTRQPIRGGIGALLLTTLTPFVQKQPLVRYWTGDMVELHPGCPMDDFGFSIKGRIARSVVVREAGGAVALLRAADVYDTLDDFPEVASSEMFRHVPVRDHSALGHLKFRLACDDAARPVRVRMEVELRADPDRRAEDTGALLRRMEAAVLGRHPELASRIGDGSAEFLIEAAPPGSLPSFLPDEVE